MCCVTDVYTGTVLSNWFICLAQYMFSSSFHFINFVGWCVEWSFRIFVTPGAFYLHGFWNEGDDLVCIHHFCWLVARFSGWWRVYCQHEFHFLVLFPKHVFNIICFLSNCLSSYIVLFYYSLCLLREEKKCFRSV